MNVGNKKASISVTITDNEPNLVQCSSTTLLTCLNVPNSHNSNFGNVSLLIR